MRYDMIVSERKGREKMVTREQKKEFTTILEEKCIRPVYQPIVSLKTGDVYAYEALTRVSLPDCSFNTEQMFHIAEELNCVWKLEELCRKMNLKHAGNGKLRGKRLFINVDPNVIHDEKFKEGITCKYLKKYGLAPSDIIFEITERTSIDDAETFRNIINHYKKQQYRIAILINQNHSGVMLEVSAARKKRHKKEPEDMKCLIMCGYIQKFVKLL